MKTTHKLWDIFKVRGGILYSLMSVCCRIVDLDVVRCDSWGGVTCKACLRLRGKEDENDSPDGVGLRGHRFWWWQNTRGKHDASNS